MLLLQEGAAGVMDVVWEGQNQPWAPWVSPGALLASSPPQHGMQLIAGPKELSCGCIPPGSWINAAPRQM